MSEKVQDKLIKILNKNNDVEYKALSAIRRENGESIDDIDPKSLLTEEPRSAEKGAHRKELNSEKKSEEAKKKTKKKASKKKVVKDDEEK